MRTYIIEGSCITCPSDFFHAAALDLRFRNFYNYDFETLPSALADFTGCDEVPLVRVTDCAGFARSYPEEYARIYSIFRKVEAEGAIGLEWEAPEPDKGAPVRIPSTLKPQAVKE